MSLTADRFIALSLVPLVLTVSTSAFSQPQIATEKVIGRNTCNICHSSELAAWEKSSHNLKAWKLLDHPKAPEFAKAMGVTDIKGASLCTQCHGTQSSRTGKMTIAQGNSCESCHGGAGGRDGWFRLHFDFGVGRKITRDTKMADLRLDRVKETPEHRAARETACKKAGLNRSADAFNIARNCLQCHLVPNEKLVAAGHPMSTKFEFVEWAQGEVRHNFLLDPKVNAEVPTNWSDELRGKGRTAEGRKRLMFVAGMIADLDVCLRTRATVTSTRRGTLGDEANDRILDIQEELEEIEVAELKTVLAAIADLDKSTLREIIASDKQKYIAVADAVAKAAGAFVAAHQDGNKLPASIKVPSRAKGEAYQP